MLCLSWISSRSTSVLVIILFLCNIWTNSNTQTRTEYTDIKINHFYIYFIHIVQIFNFESYVFRLCGQQPTRIMHYHLLIGIHWFASIDLHIEKIYTSQLGYSYNVNITIGIKIKDNSYPKLSPHISCM